MQYAQFLRDVCQFFPSVCFFFGGRLSKIHRRFFAHCSGDNLLFEWVNFVVGRV